MDVDFELARELDAQDAVEGNFARDFPSNWQVDYAEACAPAQIACEQLAVATAAALADPIAALPLRDLSQSAATVTLVCDALPLTAIATMLPVVLAEIPDTAQVTVLVGGAVFADSARAVVNEHVQVVVHDADDAAAHNDLGNVQGVPVRISHIAAEADVLVALTAVKPATGWLYTNAATSLINTAAARHTQSELTTAHFLDEAATWTGRLQDLPQQHLAREIAKRAGLAFSIELVLDDAERVLAVYAGNPDAVFAASLAVAQEARAALVPHDDYDVVFAITPQAQTIYQVSAAVVALGKQSTSPLMHGGLIVVRANVTAPGDDGGGDAEDFYDALMLAREPDGVLRALGRSNLRPGQGQAYQLAQTIAQHRVMVVGKDIDDLARACHMLPARNWQEALDLTESLVGHRPRVLVVVRPEYTLPLFDARVRVAADHDIEWLNGVDVDVDVDGDANWGEASRSRVGKRGRLVEEDWIDDVERLLNIADD